MKSYENGKDVFENIGKAVNDHIWPLSKNGSGSQDNIQLLTEKSNSLKGDKTNGKINGIKFGITEIGRTDSNKIIGQMAVKIDGQWIDVKS